MPLSLPTQKRECGIFGPGMVKNSIRTTGVKLARPHLMYASPSARVAIYARYGLSKFFPPYMRNILICITLHDFVLYRIVF